MFNRQIKNEIVDNFKDVIKVKSKYHKFAGRETCIARDETWILWLTNNGLKSLINIPIKNVYDYYVEESSYLKILKKLETRLVNNWSGHVQRYAGQKKSIIEKSKRLSQSVLKKDQNTVLINYINYYRQLYKFNEYIWGAWAIIYHTENYINKKFSEYMNLITSLNRPISYISMERDLTRKTPKQMVKEYAWLRTYNPFEKPYNINDFISIKKNIDSKDIRTKYLQFRRNNKQFESFIKNITNKTLRTKVNMVRTYAWLKTDRTDTWRQVMYYSRDFYKYLAGLSGFNLRDACNLFSNEIINLLMGKEKPNNQLIKNRSLGRAMYIYKPGGVTISYQYKSFIKVINQLTKLDKKKNVIKGTVTFKGKVVGRAKVINKIKDLKTVKKGDIFVAQYTFPSFTPYMVKCSAVVTNEGGQTSHAAIISREYKIPGIVGTKYATKLLITGDLVEVDANKGIIKKL
ncbi:PEP-utilizing enzyme [Patescibacteria group bacterium]